MIGGRGISWTGIMQIICTLLQKIFTAWCTTVQSTVLLSLVVSPPVCDVGRGSWSHGLKILEIVRPISPTSSLFVAQRSPTYPQMNMDKFGGRLEVRWEKVACWSTKAAISLKRVKIEEKLLRKSPTLFRFFGSPSYFYFRFRLYDHQDGRFCLIFASTAQQSVLDGTNWLSSFKPCAYCRIVHRADIFAIAQLSCLQPGCSSWRPTNSVKALNATG